MACLLKSVHLSLYVNVILYKMRTQLAYIANAKKSCYMKQQSHSFESARYMTSVMALDGVTSFGRLKDVKNTCKRLQNSPSFGGMSSVQWRKD